MAKLHKSRRGQMRRLSTMVDPLIEPAVLKRGFALNKLVSHWDHIVGDCAAWCRPDGLTFPRGRQNDGTLKLQISSGRGPQAQAMAPEIIDRVNAAFGYQAINRISLVQTLTPTEKPEPAYTPPQISDAADIWALDEKLKHIKSPALRAALRRLGGPVGTDN
jgi:hypothetical protein